MNRTVMVVLNRYLQRCDVAEAETIWTVIRLLFDNNDQIVWRKIGVDGPMRKLSISVQQLTVLLEHAEPSELAEILSSTILKEVPANVFHRYMEDLWTQQLDERTLCCVGFAAYRFLLRNRSAFVFPGDLARRLLASDDVNSMVIGLRLLCFSDDDQIATLESIIQALQTDCGPASDGIDILAIDAVREFLLRYRDTLNSREIERLKTAISQCLSRKTAKEDIDLVRSCLASF